MLTTRRCERYSTNTLQPRSSVLGHVCRRPAGTTASVMSPNARRGNWSGVTAACETAESRDARRHQFDMQRRLYQSKFTSFWLATANTCEGNPRVLWQTVSKLLQPPRQQATDKLSVDDFRQFFRSKVDNIRMSTASADPSVIVARQSPPFFGSSVLRYVPSNGRSPLPPGCYG